MRREPGLARRFFDRFEPVHAVTYFAPEALSALAVLADDEVEALFRALTPIARAVVAGGDIPALTPMSLRRDELDDGSAHLGC